MKKSVILLLILLASTWWLRAQTPKAEYYFDTDPGVSLGTPVSVVQTGDIYNFNGNISTAGLSAGFHRIYFRFNDDFGRWGLTENCLLFVFSTAAPNLVPNQPVVTAMEYYYDTDPGVGLANPIAVATLGDQVTVTSNISTNNLTTGFHRIYVRAKDMNGRWSLAENQLLFVFNTTAPTPVSNQPAIAAMEYFIDHDPGVGQATPLPQFSPGDSVSVIATIPTSTLTGGKHAICIRAKDLNGKWSIYETKILNNCTSIPVADFSATQVCYGSQTSFADLSTNKDANTLYAWDFNSDGTNESTTSGNLNYTYPKAGNFNARLVLTNPDGCSNEVSHTVTVDTIPSDAGIITGPIVVSKGQSSVNYSVPAITGATTYVWNLPSGATGSSSTNTISVSFGASAVSGDLTVKGQNNCGDGKVSILAVTVNNAPVANAGSDQTVNEETLVVLDGSGSSDPDHDPITYSWTPPEGITLSSNSEANPTFTAPQVIGDQRFLFTLVVNDGLCNSFADTVFITVSDKSLSENFSLESGIFGEGEECFNALKTIIVAGGDYLVEFFIGSSITLIAGQSIRFLPGFHAHSGCWMDAHITTNGTFCDGASGSIVQQPQHDKSGDVNQGFLPEQVSDKEKSVKVYPNPNNGNFTIELSNLAIGTGIRIYNMLGNIVFRSIVNNPQQQQVNLGGIVKGLYMVKIIDGKEQFVRKILVYND